VCGTTSSSCGTYVCSTTACKTSCSAQADCSTGNYCNSSSQCVADKLLGASCTADVECGSGHCAPEGICCDQACTGQCEQSSAAGACSFATGTPAAPRAVCTGQGTTPCGGSCSGTSASCTYPTVACNTANAGCASMFSRYYAKNPGTCTLGT